jgi:hypothetical protein
VVLNQRKAYISPNILTLLGVSLTLIRLTNLIVWANVSFAIAFFFVFELFEFGPNADAELGDFS